MNPYSALSVQEGERLAALRRYNILDTPPELAFNRITSLAARLFKVPTALVALIDESRIWFKSSYGWTHPEVPRDTSIFHRAVLYDEVCVVLDARQDEWFACHPLIQGEPGLRFYAGAPLLTPDGINLGTLCLLDTQPQDTFTDEQKMTLADLAAIVMDQMELRLAASMADSPDRKRSEQSLQAESQLIRQEQRYRYIFEAVSVAIWEEDFSEAKAAIDRLKASGVEDFRQYFADHPDVVQHMIRLVRIRDVNQASLQMFEAQEKAELLASLDQIFVPETQATFVDELLAIAHGESFFAAETVLQTLRGDRLNVWVAITFPLPSESYNHVLVSLLDITQRKQAEAALQASEERYRHLAEATPQIVWTTDAGGMATYFNPYWYDYTGLSEAESMGLESPNALHPEDRDRVLQQWLVAVERGESYEIEIRLRRWDGVYRWFLCRGLPLYDAKGQIMSWVGTSTDIDDQKHIQDALRESEERLSLALRSAQAGMWQWFKADNRTIWSQENFELMGYEPGQIVSSYETWLQAVHPDDRELVQQAVQQTLDENSSLYFEYRVCLPDGSIRWLADIGQITYDEQGNQEGMIGLQIDISKRKQIELKQERSEAILNAFLTASPIALTLFDPELRFIYANEALAELNNRPLSDHIGRTLWEVVPVMAPQFAPLLQQIIDTQEPVLNLEYQGEVQPGVYRHTMANHFPVCLPNGDVLGVGVTVTDISELKRVEAKLRQSEERLSLALKAANQGLYDLNIRTGETIVSPEYARMLGYEPDELQETNAKWRDRLHPDDVEGVYQKYEDYVTGRYSEYRAEFRQRTKTGGWVWILSVGKIVAWDHLGNPSRMIGTHTDINDRKHAEQALQQQTDQLVQANRVKDEFLAVLSHELRSPLNPILGWTKLLQAGNFDARKTQQALEIIERNAKQQTQLIDDLLDISKILRGKLILNEAPVDLEFTVEAALETVRLAAEAKQIRMVKDVDASLPPVLGDSGRLHQIVLNLLSNAIKFTPTGGQVEVRLSQVGLEAQLQVKDTGKGISPDFLPYVFDSFQQEDSKTTRRFGGLGLGLAIVRQLTELHGGTVWAESPGEGAGATFTLRLPRLRQDFNRQTPSSSGASFSRMNALQGTRILVVDDEADMRDLVVTILEQAGAMVQTTASATEALAMIGSFQPMLLISDIGMPDVDGYMLMRQVRALPPDQGGSVVAIALTAYASELDQQQTRQAGFQKHIAKPVEPDVLLRAIIDLI